MVKNLSGRQNCGFIDLLESDCNRDTYPKAAQNRTQKPIQLHVGDVGW